MVELPLEVQPKVCRAIEGRLESRSGPWREFPTAATDRLGFIDWKVARFSEIRPRPPEEIEIVPDRLLRCVAALGTSLDSGLLSNEDLCSRRCQSRGSSPILACRSRGRGCWRSFVGERASAADTLGRRRRPPRQASLRYFRYGRGSPSVAHLSVDLKPRSPPMRAGLSGRSAGK